MSLIILVILFWTSDHFLSTARGHSMVLIQLEELLLSKRLTYYRALGRQNLFISSSLRSCCVHQKITQLTGMMTFHITFPRRSFLTNWNFLSFAKAGGGGVGLGSSSFSELFFWPLCCLFSKPLLPRTRQPIPRYCNDDLRWQELENCRMLYIGMDV